MYYPENIEVRQLKSFPSIAYFGKTSLVSKITMIKHLGGPRLNIFKISLM